jgi:penicillin V acylase-like amidase (Ntn superfamily)
MIKWLAFVLGLSVAPLTSIGCSTFFLNKDGQMAFGKNYDWMTGIGSVNTNLRGLAKASLYIDNGAILKWVSRYGSITFNQYGKEFPNGGMNEKGLVVELMWLDGSIYPEKDNRPALTVLQWIQYQLDNCSSVDEVIATDKIQRIVSTGAPQHYLVADAHGNVAAIEFLKGRMVVHRKKDLPYPVLTNSTYEASVKAVSSKKTPDNSLDRFSKACSMIERYHSVSTKKTAVEYSFDILSAVAQPGFTKWSIVYDITNRKIYFKTSDHSKQKMIAVNDFEYGCGTTPTFYDLNQNDVGDISKRFAVYNNEENIRMLKAAFKESSGLNITEEIQDRVGDLVKRIHCR